MIAFILSVLYFMYGSRFRITIEETNLNGPQKLRVWLAVNKVTIDAFATQLGTSGAAVSRWASGIHLPSRHWMQCMQEMTLGYIEPPDWLREAGPVPRGKVPAIKRERIAS